MCEGSASTLVSDERLLYVEDASLSCESFEELLDSEMVLQWFVAKAFGFEAL